MTLKVAVHHRFDPFVLDASFEAGPGITALFGRSGAGKTSLINAVAGLLRPTTGRITLGETVFFDAATSVDLRPEKRRLGYVFQDARLFPHLSVQKNLTFGQDFAPQSAQGPDLDEVCALLGLTDLLARMPRNLSGGEKQRVALGRALLSKPRMLLMDEPLASLDAARKQEILPYLETLRDGPLGIPILYVSHALEEIARLADHLVVIKAGRVALQGPLHEVMSDPAAVPLLGVREAGAVLTARVLSHADDGLSRLQISAGALELPGVRASIGAWVRVRILAQDVILANHRPEGLSSVNILPVEVLDVHAGEGPGAAIALQTGTDRLLARVTARAVGELGLRPGHQCYAILKVTTVAPQSIGR
ncbi:MAG: molybdenum ABC transporter ATP-binding protein [Pseudomonadota bacterium]